LQWLVDLLLHLIWTHALLTVSVHPAGGYELIQIPFQAADKAQHMAKQPGGSLHVCWEGQ
jgi:hypothetical protein